MTSRSSSLSKLNTCFATIACFTFFFAPKPAEGKSKKKVDPIEKWFKDHGTGRTFCDPFAKECNPATGLMLIVDEEADDFNVGSCTGFLAGPDILISNGHCPSDELKTEPQSSCKGKIYFSLPQTEEFEEEIFGCDKILKYSNTSPTATGDEVFYSDYTVIKLDRPSKHKRWLQISDEGLPDNLPIKIFKVKVVRPDEKKKRSKIIAFQQTQECSFVHNTILLPSFDHHFRPVGIMPECHIQKGQSGSPIVDSSGKVRAILQAGTMVDEVALNTKESAEVMKKRIHNAFAVASNFACIDPLSLNLPVRPECQVTADSDEGKLIMARTGERIYRKFEAEFQALIDSYLATNSLEKTFLWEPSALDNDILTTYVLERELVDSRNDLLAWGFGIPKCIDQHADIFTKPNGEMIDLTRPDKAVIISKMPFWPIYRSLTRGKAALHAGKEVRYREVAIEYSPSQVERLGHSTVKISHDLNEFVEVVLFEGEVVACSQLPSQCLP